MGYPTSVPAFASKNTGDGVQAAHINDLQTEVTALATGLLNGLSHAVTVSTGGLTVSTGNTILGQNLSVAGNSTLAGTLTVSSAATFASLITASAQPRVHVYSTAAVQLPADTFTALSWESEQFDVGGLHSTAANPTRLTVPAGSSGLYLCGAMVRFSTGGAGNQVFLRLFKNSTAEVYGGPSAARGSSASVSLSLTAPLVLDGGDYVEIEAFPTTSTGSIPSAANLRRISNEFWLMRVW